VTKELTVIYEMPIPVQSLVIVRCWLYQICGKDVRAECDVISKTGRHARALATLSVFPHKPESDNILHKCFTKDIEAKLIPLKAQAEQLEDVKGFPQDYPIIDFPENNFLVERFKDWNNINLEIQFPYIFDKKDRKFFGQHVGRHFDMVEMGGTMRTRLFEKDGEKVGLVYFSPYAEGKRPSFIEPITPTLCMTLIC
jgi:hypothetical protein